MLRFLLGFLIILIGFSGCQRTVDSSVGPSICPQDFEVVSPLKASVSSIDFTASSTSSVKFEATLSGRDYRWTLQIKGKKSKATKTFTGNSAIVNESWYGEPDSSVFFQQEECDVLLTINCIDVASSATVTITKVNDFSNYGWMLYKLEGTSFPDHFGQSVAGLDTINASGTVGKSPEGGKFYTMAGMSEKPTWYFDEISLGSFKNIGPEKYKYIEGVGKLSSDPNDIYMNFYANTGGNPNSEIAVRIQEQDQDEKLADALPYFIRAADISGWQLISINLGKDCSVKRADKLKSIKIILGAYPKPATTAEMNLDMIIFTKGKPFSK